MLTVLDLFSGIGGISLGLESTGGFRTVAFCEIEPFCREVLRKHWPGVPIHEDVRTLTKEKLIEALANQARNRATSDLSTVSSLRGGSEPVRERPIGTGSGRQVWPESAGDVGHPEAARRTDAAEANREGKSLPPGNASRRPRTEPSRGRNPQGHRETEDAMRELRDQFSDLQGRSDSNSSASPGLRETLGGDVALPAMSSPLAQDEPTARKEVMPSEAPDTDRDVPIVDVIVGGFP